MNNAICLALHFIFQHLEFPGFYVHLLSLEHSSAFNTFILCKLFDKLLELSLSQSACFWIIDFLLHRPQRVRVNNCFANILVLSTATPQGCALSPFLFFLFTKNFQLTYQYEWWSLAMTSQWLICESKRARNWLVKLVCGKQFCTVSFPSFH